MLFDVVEIKNTLGMKLCLCSVLFGLLYVTDSHLSGGASSWPVDKDVARTLRSTVEGAVPDAPLTKEGLSNLLRSLHLDVGDALKDDINNGGSGWLRCDIDTVDGGNLTRPVFQARHLNKVRHAPCCQQKYFYQTALFSHTLQLLI